MLKLWALPVSAFHQNCRIIAAPQGDAVVVDPGADALTIYERLCSLSLRCGQIWLTHSHLDHCGGVKTLRERTGATLYAHASEQGLRKNIKSIAAMLGADPAEFEECPEPDVALNDGVLLEVGGVRFQAFHSPGHSPGSICFYSRDDGILLAGDVLFAGSIGRTDLPGGSHTKLLASIRRLMRELPPDTRVLSGHGPETTLERERRSNPFLMNEDI